MLQKQPSSKQQILLIGHQAALSVCDMTLLLLNQILGSIVNFAYIQQKLEKFGMTRRQIFLNFSFVETVFLTFGDLNTIV